MKSTKADAAVETVKTVNGGATNKGAHMSTNDRKRGTAKAKTAAKAKTKAKAKTATRDARLPKVGTVLTSSYKGKSIKATVRADGIEYKGKTYRSVSAVAGKVAGHKYNGFAFFGLLKG